MKLSGQAIHADSYGSSNCSPAPALQQLLVKSMTLALGVLVNISTLAACNIESEQLDIVPDANLREEFELAETSYACVISESLSKHSNSHVVTPLAYIFPTQTLPTVFIGSCVRNTA